MKDNSSESKKQLIMADSGIINNGINKNDEENVNEHALVKFEEDEEISGRMNCLSLILYCLTCGQLFLSGSKSKPAPTNGMVVKPRGPDGDRKKSKVIYKPPR